MQPISPQNLPVEQLGDHGPLLVLLHWLGGSSKSWHGVTEVLSSRGVRCVAINLPGFGDANASGGFDVRTTSNAVIETVQALRRGKESEPWVIGGHSMGGKIGAVVARHAADGMAGLQNLRGAFLVSPSPPSPEPMEESKREQMLKQLGESSGDAEEDRKRAQKFVDDNTGKLALTEVVRSFAVNDVLRMNRTAFRAWLNGGSKEDWSGAVGTLPLPAMILTGSEEPALGAAAQQKLTLPHYTAGNIIELRGGGHLAPLERPFEVAEHATTFLVDLGFPLEAGAAKLGFSFSALLESNRVSPQTRAVMETRIAAAATWAHKPSVLSAEAFRTMRSLAACIVPRAGFDIAGNVEERLANGAGDGWRFATLPPDADAWKKGLASLNAAAERMHKVPFVALPAQLMTDMLKSAMAGNLGKGFLGSVHLGESADAYSADEMKQWLEEVRAEFTKCYVAHPATMERIGYTGFADDGGFTQIQIGQREEFER